LPGAFQDMIPRLKLHASKKIVIPGASMKGDRKGPNLPEKLR